MADIVSSLVGANNTNTETKSKANLNGEPIPTFKIFSEDITPLVQATIISETDITGNTTLIWGNPTYGIWNSYKWGTNYSSSTIEVTRVILEGDYNENFYSLAFCDTTNTTCTGWGI